MYDPWPEYSKLGILPVNATLGPGGTYDPYWLPIADVDLGDTRDVFFVSTTAIPEFSTLLVPVVGMMMVAAVVYRTRSRRDSA